jgi:hypothetical protein
VSAVTPMSASFFSNHNLDICLLADNRQAYQLYFGSRNNTVTRSFTAEFENEYADCYDDEGLSLELSPDKNNTSTTRENDNAVTLETPSFEAVVADNQIGRIYLNVGDLYEQVSYV